MDSLARSAVQWIGGGVGYTISQDRTGGMAGMLVGGLIVGALAGNSWSFLFQPRK